MDLDDTLHPLHRLPESRLEGENSRRRSACRMVKFNIMARAVVRKRGSGSIKENQQTMTWIIPRQN